MSEEIQSDGPYQLEEENPSPGEQDQATQVPIQEPHKGPGGAQEPGLIQRPATPHPRGPGAGEDGLDNPEPDNELEELIAAVVPSAPTMSLPHPEKPQQYTKHNRMEYNRWMRNCEVYFNCSPGYFPVEALKIDFATSYILEPLKTLWEAHCSTERMRALAWQPTWDDIKLVMLNALGTESKHMLQASEALRKAVQRPNQSPTELLDYLRPYWEELGSLKPVEAQVLDFTLALHNYIKKDLLMLSPERRNTIPLVEENAMIIYCGKGPVKEPREFQPKNNTNKLGQNLSKPEGVKRTPKRPRSATLGYSGGNLAKKAKPQGGSTDVSCWNCREPGHTKPNCPKLLRANKDSKKSNDLQEGKGKGRQS
ncbi:hypothetical protein EJ02DRAFT_459210 [Clathrospora elynae]|uniref:CCHC-type domain-containing protein n=1 Tax=Clathrospora elynae TaxID=706981 RepID=A0A6A5S9V4_9PLEO|nr:hypothetical protein EJ02DRAFT_459210 [Clathrospora elynae]